MHTSTLPDGSNTDTRWATRAYVWGGCGLGTLRAWSTLSTTRWGCSKASILALCRLSFRPWRQSTRHLSLEFLPTHVHSSRKPRYVLRLCRLNGPQALIGLSQGQIGSCAATGHAALQHTSTTSIVKVFLTAHLGPTCAHYSPYSAVLISEDARHGISYSHAYELKPKYFSVFCTKLRAAGCDADGHLALQAAKGSAAALSAASNQSKAEAHHAHQQARGIRAVFAAHELGSPLVSAKKGDDVVRDALNKALKAKGKGAQVAIVIADDGIR